MRRVVVLVVVSLVGCKAKDKPREVPPVVNEPVAKKAPVDISFVVATPEITSARVPERFAAPLPHTRAMLDKRETFAPYPYIEASIAANTNGMRERVIASVKLATAKTAVDDEMARWYPNLIGYLPSEEVCDWLEGIATGSEPPALRGVFWRMAERCIGPDLAQRMIGDEVPDDVVVSGYSSLEAPLPFNPRAARAATNVAKKTKVEYQLALVGRVFANMSGPESRAAFLALQKSLPAVRAAAIGVGLVDSPDPAMRELGLAACKHPSVADDRTCEEADNPREARALARGDAKPATNDELANCARTSSRYEAAECLRALAGKDRAAAVAIATSADRTKDDLYSMVATGLVAYPDADSLPKYLAAVGVTAVKPPTVAMTTIEQALEAYGRLDRFDTETGMFPNQHDELLARLATLASPALDGVLFEENPPKDSEGAGPYVLVAYSDRRRFALSAQNNGDWYDMEAVIGLLNAVLVDRRSSVRFVTLPTGDQTATVLAGSARALGQLVADGAIKLESANAAMKDGKEFEDRAIRQLQEQLQAE